MSRRRRLDPLLDGMRTATDWRVEVVCDCTGRPRRIGLVTSRNGNPPEFTDGFVGAGVLDGEGHTTVTAACRTCGTTVPMRLDHARIVLARHDAKHVALSDLAAMVGSNSEVDPG